MISKYFPSACSVLLSLLLVSACASETPAGDIDGHIVLPKKKPVKIAKSYASGAETNSDFIADVPPVAFLESNINNTAYTPEEDTFGIVQENKKFVPSLLIVPVGASVEFPNNDYEFHNVYSYSKTKRFDLGRYPRGVSKTVLFNNPGIVKIYCEVHAWMRAAVVVVENPFFSVIDEAGYFKIKDIPPGAYKLTAWSIDGGLYSREVKIKQNGALKIELGKKDLK